MKQKYFLLHILSPQRKCYIIYNTQVCIEVPLLLRTDGAIYKDTKEQMFIQNIFQD